MDISNVIVSHNCLKMKVKCTTTTGKEMISPSYNIHFNEFQLKGLVVNSNSVWYLLMKFKRCIDDGLLYTLTLNSTELDIISKKYVSDDCEWRVIGCSPFSTVNFGIEIIVDTKTSSYFETLVDDESMTDFEIKGKDGSIRLHRVVLAAASEVFRKMLSIECKEKKEAVVEFPYSKCVLQDLKDYLYLNRLNDDNLENLLLLAHCYMMCELKQKCITRLVFNITRESSLALIEFAANNMITELMIATLNMIQEKKISFENFNEIMSILNGERGIEQ